MKRREILLHQPSPMRTWGCAAVAIAVVSAAPVVRAADPDVHDTAAAESDDELRPRAGRPRVHLELSRPVPVALYEVRGEAMAVSGNVSAYAVAYASVCRAPCNRVVDGSAGQSFFVATVRDTGGVGVASKRFSLIDHAGDLRIRVKPGRIGLRVGGYALGILGVMATAGGASSLAMGAALHRPGYRKIGVPLLAAGVPAIVGGIVMVALGRTRFEIVDRDAVARGPVRRRLAARVRAAAVGRI